MALGYHCDFPDCDTWTRIPREHGFVFVQVDEDADVPLMFCCMDHAGRWLMLNSHPLEEYPGPD